MMIAGGSGPVKGILIAGVVIEDASLGRLGEIKTAEAPVDNANALRTGWSWLRVTWRGG